MTIKDSLQLSINQSIQKVLTQSRDQHCTVQITLHKIQNCEQLEI